MTEMSDWANVVIAIVSVLALFVAARSTQIAKAAQTAADRSANAAERSAAAAESALSEERQGRKLNQFSSLSPYFESINHIIAAFNGSESTNGAKINKAADAVQSLKNAMHEDTVFEEVLDSLTKAISNTTVQAAARHYAADSERINLSTFAPADLADIKIIVDEKRKHYLGIV